MPIVPGEREEDKKKEPAKVQPPKQETFTERVDREVSEATKVRDIWERNVLARERVTRGNFSRDKVIGEDNLLRMFRAKNITGLDDETVIGNLDAIESEIEVGNFKPEKIVKNPAIWKNFAKSQLWRELSPKQLNDLDITSVHFKRPDFLWPMTDQMIEEEKKILFDEQFEAIERISRQTPGMEIPQRAASEGREMTEEEELQSALTHPLSILNAGRAMLHLGMAKTEDEILGELKARERYIGGEGEIGSVEVLSRMLYENPAKPVPVAGALQEFINSGRVLAIAKRLEDNPRDRYAQVFMRNLARTILAEEERGHSIMGGAADIMTGIPATAGEIMIGGGLPTLGKQAIKTGTVETSEHFVKRMAMKALHGFLSYGKLTAGVGAPRVLSGMAQEMTPEGVITTKNGDYVYEITPGTGKKWYAALPSSFRDQFIEFATEGLGGTALMRAVDSRVNSFVGGLFRRWLSKNPTGTAKAFQEFAASAGINGVLGEMAEEEAAKFFQDVTRLQAPTIPLVGEGTTGKELASQAVAFSAFPLLRGAANMRRQRDGQFLKTSIDQVEKLLEDKVDEVSIMQVIHDSTTPETRFAHYDIKEWDQAFAQEDMSPVDVARVLSGSAEAYAQAKQLGTTLKLPIETVTMFAAKNPDQRAFLEKGGLSADSFYQSDVPDAPEEPTEGAETAPDAKEVSEAKGRPQKPVKPTPESERELAAADAIQAKAFEELQNANLQQIEGVRDLSVHEMEMLATVTADRAIRRAKVRNQDPEALYKESRVRFSADPTKKGQRAQITFGPKFTDIELWATGDKTSIIHEMGHSWLQEIQEDLEYVQTLDEQTLTSDQSLFVEDAKAILEDIGAKSFDEISRDRLAALEKKMEQGDKAATKEAKRVRGIIETFAKKTERFFAEGKAPSDKLRRAYNRIKEWFISVYNDIARIGVDLSPEMREVFGRLLASEANVIAAYERIGGSNLLQGLKDMGFSDKQAEIHTRRVTDARAQAYENMTSSVSKRYGEKYRRQVREQVANELAQNQDIQAYIAITTGKLPDGTDFVPDSGLDPGYKLASEGLTAEQIRALPKGVVKKGGADRGIAANDYKYINEESLIDGLTKVAELFRALNPAFQHEQEIIQQIATLKAEEQDLRAGKKDVKDNLVAQEALQKSLDAVRKQRRISEKSIEAKGTFNALVGLVTDARVREFGPTPAELAALAEDAILTDKQAELHVLEMNLLAEGGFTTVKGIAKKLSRPIRSAKEYMEDAWTKTSAKSFKEADPRDFKQTEERWAREAQDLFFKGDIEGAIDAYEMRLENFAMGKAAKELRDVVSRGAKKAKTIRSEPKQSRLGRGGGNYMEQMVKAAVAKNLITEKSAKMDVSDDAIKPFNEWLAEIRSATETGLIEPHVANERVMNKEADWMETPMADMLDFFETFSSMEHIASSRSKAISEAFGETLFENAKALSDAAIKSGKYRAIPPNERNVAVASGKNFKNVFGELVKMGTRIAKADGFDFGPWWGLIEKPRQAAADLETDMRIKADKAYLEAERNIGKLSKVKRDFTEKRQQIEGVEGLQLTKTETMVACLNMGVAQNAEVMAETLGTRYIQGRETPLDAAEMAAVRNSLTRQEWEVVRGIWKVVAMYNKEKAELYKKMTGRPFPFVKTRKIMTPLGEIEGGFYSLVYDQRLPGGGLTTKQETKQESTNRAVLETMHGSTIRATTPHGYRMERSQNKGRPLSLDLRNAKRQIYEVIHDITHWEFVTNAYRLLEYKKTEARTSEDGEEVKEETNVEAAIKDYHGYATYNGIRNGLREAAAGQKPRLSWWENWIGYLSKATAMSRLSFSATVGTLQPLGILSAGPRIGWRWVAKGIEEYGSAPRHKFNQMKEESLPMRNRANTFDIAHKTMSDTETALGEVLAPLVKIGSAYTAFMQVNTDAIIYYGAKAKHMDALLKEGKSEQEAEKEAIARAGNEVRTTQGSGQWSDLAPIQKIKLLQPIMLFTGYFNSRMNTMIQQVGKRWMDNESKTKASALIAADFVQMYWVQGLASVWMLSILRGEDPDDEFWGNMLEAGMDPLADYPLIRDFASAAKGFEPKGPAGLQQVGAIAKAFERGDRKSILEAIGLTTGLVPASQLNRTLDGIKYFDEYGPTSLFFGVPYRGRRR